MVKIGADLVTTGTAVLNASGDLDGKSLGCWGGPGRAAGKLHNPWALAVDSRGRVHVVDSENHRVQRIRF